MKIGELPHGLFEVVDDQRRLGIADALAIHEQATDPETRKNCHRI